MDTIGRMVAEKLQERLKQPVVVENRAGAGGVVGVECVAKAAPDGRTLLLIEISAMLHKWLHKSVPFDVIADFAPVAQVATTPLLLFANPSLPVNDVKELIAYAKANPGKLAVGTPGVGIAASSGGLDAQCGRQDRHHPCALSRHRARAQRSPRRTDPDDLGQPHRGDAACRDRQGEGARHRVGAAQSRCFRRCRPCENAAAGFRRRLVRRRRSGQDAAGGRRAARPGDRRVTGLPEVQKRMAKLGYELGYRRQRRSSAT